jgi:hypothetical protein
MTQAEVDGTERAKHVNLFSLEEEFIRSDLKLLERTMDPRQLARLRRGLKETALEARSKR